MKLSLKPARASRASRARGFRGLLEALWRLSIGTDVVPHIVFCFHMCKAMRTFVCVSVFCFLFFGASAWHRKPPQVYSSVVYTPRHAKISSHSHPQKQSLGLQHNKALACIPPARSWLLLRVIWQAGLVKVASLFGRQFSS